MYVLLKYIIVHIMSARSTYVYPVYIGIGNAEYIQATQNIWGIVKVRPMVSLIVQKIYIFL